MGRKILKSNRHKKLKAIDPFYTGNRKLFLDKSLVYANQKPFDNDADEQKIPLKLKEYLDLNEKLKQRRKEVEKEVGGLTGKSRKEKKKKISISSVLNSKPDERGAEVPVKAVKQLKKLDNESDTAFLNRLDQEVSVVLNKAQYETQYECTLETKDDKVIIKKDKKMSERKKRQLGKLKEKLKYDKEMKIEDENDRILFKDTIQFGEIAHQPPTLRPPKISRKYANSEAVTLGNKKSGCKDLLLKQKLVEKPSAAKRITFTDKNKLNDVNLRKCVDDKGKVTEADRNAVIESYRQLKKSGKFK